MPSTTSTASRRPWPITSAPAASTAPCAVIFITLRSARSAASSTSTMATGLKAAPRLSKMPAEDWRFSPGPRRTANTPPPSSRTPSPFQPEESRLSGAAAFRVLIVTDAWHPQVNGVVRTLEMLGHDLEALGHQVRYATPEGRLSVPMPTYPEIRLALFPRRGLEKMVDDFDPNAIHIATEGTLGMSARAICLKRAIPYTTSFHTRFPEYVRARFPIVPESAVYGFLRWFHGPAATMMVATPSLKSEMEAHGFTNVSLWSRGVDVDAFRPIEGASLPFAKPIWLNVGRVAVEKNLDAFLSLDLPGTKVIVGDESARAHLARKYQYAEL